MWQFVQSTGELLHNWKHVTFGYSGSGIGKNAPTLQRVKNLGPIPCGTYAIGKPYQHPKLGECTMDLTPCEGTDVFGRSDFRIHGDSIEFPGTASHGCLVVNRIIRTRISESSDDLLRVVARSQGKVVCKACYELWKAIYQSAHFIAAQTDYELKMKKMDRLRLGADYFTEDDGG
jgi:hypothetical protein